MHDFLPSKMICRIISQECLYFGDTRTGIKGGFWGGDKIQFNYLYACYMDVFIELNIY